MNQSRRTFWECVEILNRDAGIIAAGTGDPPRLQFRSQPNESNNAAPAQATCLSGPFRIQAAATTRAVIGNEKLRSLRIQFVLQYEPRLRPLFLKLKGRDLQVLNGRQSLSPHSPNASRELQIGARSVQMKFKSDFDVSHNDTVSQIDITGRWNMQVSGGVAEFKFPADLTSVGMRRKKAGLTVGLEQMEEKTINGQNGMTVIILVSYAEAGRAFESHRNWLGKNDIQLRDLAGNSTSADRMEIDLQGNGAAWVRYDFATTFKNQTLVYTAPTLITDVEIPVRFKNLPVTEKLADD